MKYIKIKWIYSKSSIHIGKRGAHCNCTHVFTSYHIKISIHTPVLSPWVLDDPVVNSFLTDFHVVKSGNDDCVVYISGSAVTLTSSVVNTAFVVSESFGSLVTNRNWSLKCNSSQQLIFITSCDIDRSSWGICDVLCRVVSAGTWVFSKIRVNAFWIYSSVISS